MMFSSTAFIGNGIGRNRGIAIGIIPRFCLGDNWRFSLTFSLRFSCIAFISCGGGRERGNLRAVLSFLCHTMVNLSFASTTKFSLPTYMPTVFQPFMLCLPLLSDGVIVVLALCGCCFRGLVPLPLSGAHTRTSSLCLLVPLTFLPPQSTQQ